MDRVITGKTRFSVKTTDENILLAFAWDAHSSKLQHFHAFIAREGPGGCDSKTKWKWEKN